MSSTGYYFLANDWVYDYTCAFLSSFRTHNPTAELCWIPFNDQSDRIRQLKDVYHFQEYTDNEYLDWCDSIAADFHNPPLGTFRKLCCWNGPFESFTYIDVDTIILENLDFIFDMADMYDVLCSNGAHNGRLLDQVWKPSVFGSGLLTPDQINFAVNTGLISSHKHHLGRAFVEGSRTLNQQLKRHMVLHCQEQPLLNSLIVTKSDNYKTISEWADGNPDMPSEWWAGSEKPDVTISDGTVVYPPNSYITNRPFMIHWSSFGDPAEAAPPYIDLWLHYKHQHDVSQS